MNPYGCRTYTSVSSPLRNTVHVMDLLALIRRESKDQPNELHACHRSKDFFKVDAGLVHVPICDEASLVLDHRASLILFHLVDPFKVDGAVATR
jgi:hypothetical protein